MTEMSQRKKKNQHMSLNKILNYCTVVSFMYDYRSFINFFSDHRKRFRIIVTS